MIRIRSRYTLIIKKKTRQVIDRKVFTCIRYKMENLTSEFGRTNLAEVESKYNFYTSEQLVFTLEMYKILGLEKDMDYYMICNMLKSEIKCKRE